MAVLEWYYAKNGVQHGPVSAVELKQLADEGQLTSADLVWREGMEEWIPARKVKGLFVEDVQAAEPKPVDAPPESTPPESTPPESTPPQPTVQTFEKSSAAFEPSPQPDHGHVFDLLLLSARRQFTANFVRLTTEMFTAAGRYGLYAAMVLLFVFSLWLGLTTNKVNTILLGTAAVVMLVVLQYSADRYFEALDKLNQSTSSRMSSTAFLDCFALLHILGGLVALLGLAVTGVETEAFVLILPAVAGFTLCQYVAILALNHEALGIAIDPNTGAGEEAIGILSFFAKLTLRIVPVAFGLGIASGTILLIFACLLMLLPIGSDQIDTALGIEAAEPADKLAVPEEPSPMPVSGAFQMPLGGGGGEVEATAGSQEQTAESSDANATFQTLAARLMAQSATGVLIVFAALPFFSYVFFLFYYLLIDVIRAILSVPSKLDDLAAEEAVSE